MNLNRLNPSVKALTSVFIILLLAFIFDPVTPLLYCLWTIFITLLFGKVSLKRWILYFLPFFILAFGFLWTTMAFAKEAASSEMVSILWWSIPEETVLVAVALSFRVLSFASLSLLFILTTDKTEFILSLMQQLKLSPKLAYGILAGYRFLPLMKDELFMIHSAHRIRGVNRAKTVREYFQQFKRYSIPLLAGAIRKAERTAIAMESKGFTGDRNRTYFKRMKVSGSDWLFLVLMVAAFFCFAYISWELGFLKLYQGQL